MAERIDALRWPSSFVEADREIGVERTTLTVGGRRVHGAVYPPDMRRWPLGEAIVSAVLETVGPHAAALLRRRVMLLPPAPGGKTREELVRVRKVPAPVNDAAEVDLLWVVDPHMARALLWPVVHVGEDGGPVARVDPDEHGASLQRLVHAFDWSCSIITENGAVERTTLREPPWLVARWGKALTPAAHELVEYGRTLPRAQLTLGEDA
jgi:hypothetical protein